MLCCAGCGGSNFTEDDVRKVLAKRAPEHAASIKNKVYGSFKRCVQDICRSVGFRC